MAAALPQQRLCSVSGRWTLAALDAGLALFACWLSCRCCFLGEIGGARVVGVPAGVEAEHADHFGGDAGQSR
jgi:hypothetical protein